MQERHTIAKWIVSHGLVESRSLIPTRSAVANGMVATMAHHSHQPMRQW